MICAALWPDPADEHCPPAFRQAAAETIQAFAEKVTSNRQLAESCHPEAMGRWMGLTRQGNRLDAANPAHLNLLRYSLLEFIADFANWDNSTVPIYLETARALTQAAHEALGGAPGTRPLVVDPFAGGGSIPLEALRVGADAFASDLNPVAVLLNKVVLEYIPRHGQRLADEVRKWGQWVKEQAERELAQFYPRDPDGATPIAYLWARTIRCEGPGCGVNIPLLRSNDLDRNTIVNIVPTEENGELGIFIENGKNFGPTIKSGYVTCPKCGYTTPASNARKQLSKMKGGASSAEIICSILNADGKKKYSRAIADRHTDIVRELADLFARDSSLVISNIRYDIPMQMINPVRPAPNSRGISAVTAIGMDHFSLLFNARQLLCMLVLSDFVGRVHAEIEHDDNYDKNITDAITTCLAFAVDRLADYNNSLCTWVSSGGFIGHAFTKQALSNVWDFTEVYPFSGATGSFDGGVEWIAKVIEAVNRAGLHSGAAFKCDASALQLPDDSVDACVFDPPYYSEIPYGDISDFFYIWLKKSIGQYHYNLFQSELVEKEQELIVTNSCPGISKDAQFFIKGFKDVALKIRSVVKHSGVVVIVFANAKTQAWESILQSIIEGGLMVVGSWPIDTERAARTRARNAASLQSSIHLVCRPRENADGSLLNDIGDWREVLAELPRRIHEWMPRLAQEGVVGADAIFACLGPALEVFSRYSRVEKASGEVVLLREYLEQVWAAVAKEALNMIFAGADASGFEEDARLTAMWLWTLSTEVKGGNGNGTKPPVQAEEEDEEAPTGKAIGGFALEYDAARKIAQGLGAHLEALADLVEVKGETARLLPVAERARALFGRQGVEAPKKRKKAPQGLLFAELVEAEEADGGWGALKAPKLGDSVLDRLHQAMLLFAAARGEALKRFLVDDGAGKDQRFWRLAQALSALYPAASEEKRWVDGVLARKKGLGL